MPELCGPSRGASAGHEGETSASDVVLTAMSFGRNPHVAKAEAAEQKAHDAQDSSAWEQGWLEAGRQWERAAEREKDPKRRATYMEKCEAARVHASEPHLPS